VRVAVAVLGLIAAASAAAQPIALLPAVGDAPEGERKSIDGALRAAFKTADGVQLQAPSDTKRHLLSLAEMGLVCVPEDVPCLSKLGIAADVALVMVPVAGASTGSSKTVSLTIAVVDVASSALLRTAKGTLSPTDDDKLRALVAEALGKKPPDPKPPDDPHPPDHPPDVPPDVPPDPPPHDPPPDTGAGPSASTIGFIVAGVGGALGGVGLIGAVACEAIYRDLVGDFDPNTRSAVINPGRALWITTGIGAVALASGLVVAVVTQPEGSE
jgi:hypothetical protein